MNSLELIFPQSVTGFDPGAEIVFSIRWNFEEALERVELRLVWNTSGKGDQDLKVVKTVRFDSPAGRDEQQVVMSLPWGPYSFSGKLISLIWAIEVVAFPSEESIRQEIILAPQGKEVLLVRAN